jgi:glycosyltransferase involved in cell wall biosynthesis
MLSRRATGPVRVLHIVGESRYGGAAKIILGLGHVAQAEGWQADILTTDPIFQQAVTQHGLGLVNLDVIRREIRPLWDLGGLARLYSFLRNEAYDIVHTHTSKGGFVGRLAARFAGVPLIVHTVHGFAFHEDSPTRIQRFYSALERIASRWCDHVVTVSEFHRKWAIELKMCSPDRITAIPNGLADPEKPKVKAEELRAQLGVRGDDLVILNISRLAQQKGLEYLIQAAAALPPMRRRVQIIIAGDGPAREQLERLAVELGVTDRVRFIGFREDVVDLLAACDMVVLPSLREGLSISLLEAMAAGKPIVASNIGSQREVAYHAEMARFVPPANATSLTEAIVQFAGDPMLMARLAKNARMVYEKFYTEDRMLQAYRQLYLDLWAMKSPKPVSTDWRDYARRLRRRQEELSQIDSQLVSSTSQFKGQRI